MVRNNGDGWDSNFLCGEKNWPVIEVDNKNQAIQNIELWRARYNISISKLNTTVVNFQLSAQTTSKDASSKNN